MPFLSQIFVECYGVGRQIAITTDRGRLPLANDQRQLGLANPVTFPTHQQDPDPGKRTRTLWGFMGQCVLQSEAIPAPQIPTVYETMRDPEQDSPGNVATFRQLELGSFGFLFHHRPKLAHSSLSYNTANYPSFARDPAFPLSQLPVEHAS